MLINLILLGALIPTLFLLSIITVCASQSVTLFTSYYPVLVRNIFLNESLNLHVPFLGNVSYLISLTGTIASYVTLSAFLSFTWTISGYYPAMTWIGMVVGIGWVGACFWWKSTMQLKSGHLSQPVSLIKVIQSFHLVFYNIAL